MSRELYKGSPSGAILYATLRRRSDSQVWNVTLNAFEPWDDTHLADYAILLTDEGGDYYTADFPAAITAPGEYFASFYTQEGATPANDDFKLAPDLEIEWTGSGTFAHYSSEPLVRAKVGTTNASALTAWADFENNRDPAQISADIDAKLTEADDRVNLKLLTYGVALPFVAPNDYVRAQVKRAATLYALGFIIKAREDLAAPTNPNQPTPGDSLIAEGDEILDALAEAGSLTADTTDDVLVADAPIAVGATVDANGCDLPDPDVCPCNGNLWPVYRVWR